MNIFQPKLEITKIDNGYIVEYSKERISFDSDRSSRGLLDDRIEYVKDIKALLNLIKEIA